MRGNVEEAIELLTELPYAAGYNYSLVDRNGNFTVFEASQDKTNIYHEKESISCVLMFQIDEIKTYNRPNVDSSLERVKALSHISKYLNPVGEIHKWFSDQSSTVFYTDY